MFYGWWIVGASFLIVLYVAGVIIYGFTAIFEPIAEEFTWSYTQISFAASLRGLEIGILAPITGILVDRWGPRRLIFAGGFIITLGLLLLSSVTSLGMFYAAYITIAIGMSFCTMTVLMTAIANWFRKNVSIASGVVLSGASFGGLILPIIVRLIDLLGWRLTMTMFSLGGVALIIPLSLLFRHKPEQYGYIPDGKPKDVISFENAQSLLHTDDIKIGKLEAVKTRTFWQLALSSIYHMFVAQAVLTHIMPYLSTVGITRATSSFLATSTVLVGVIGRLGFGWLGDRINRKLAAVSAYTMITLGTLCFNYISIAKIWLFVPFCILFGIGHGGIHTMRPSLVREYFGRASFGTFFGFIIGITMLGNITGPLIAGWVFDNWGSYQGIWFVFAGLGAMATILVASIPIISIKTPNNN
ncbi:MFS transporter [Chloroflexota bacterium]